MKKKMRRGAVLGAALVFVWLLGGCGVSFAGFPVGKPEEFAFSCEESLLEAQEALPEASGEAGTEPEEPKPGEEKEPEAGDSSQKVNINKAGAEELTTLSGIGESRARAILEYREQQGPFEKIEDIMQIPGIKEGIFRKIKDQIAVR